MEVGDRDGIAVHLDMDDGNAEPISAKGYKTKLGDQLSQLLGDIDQVKRLDKLRLQLKASIGNNITTLKASRDEYETLYAILLTQVSKKKSQCNKELEEWQNAFYFKKGVAPTIQDYLSNSNIALTYKNKQRCSKILSYMLSSK